MLETRYALKDKGAFNSFSCLSKTLEGRGKKIYDAYWGWRACKGRDIPEEEKSMEVFMKSKVKVKITLERL